MCPQCSCTCSSCTRCVLPAFLCACHCGKEAQYIVASVIKKRVEEGFRQQMVSAVQNQYGWVTDVALSAWLLLWAGPTLRQRVYNELRMLAAVMCCMPMDGTGGTGNDPHQTFRMENSKWALRRKSSTAVQSAHQQQEMMMPTVTDSQQRAVSLTNAMFPTMHNKHAPPFTMIKNPLCNVQKQQRQRKGSMPRTITITTTLSPINVPPANPAWKF